MHGVYGTVPSRPACGAGLRSRVEAPALAPISLPLDKSKRLRLVEKALRSLFVETDVCDALDPFGADWMLLVAMVRRAARRGPSGARPVAPTDEEQRETSRTGPRATGGLQRRLKWSRTLTDAEHRATRQRASWASSPAEAGRASSELRQGPEDFDPCVRGRHVTVLADGFCRARSVDGRPRGHRVRFDRVGA